MTVDLLNILVDFPNEKKPRVTLKDQQCKWPNISVAGVPQGSLLGLTFVLNLYEQLIWQFKF